PDAPKCPTSRIGMIEATVTANSIRRPPYLSVSAPTGIRPSEPTSTGIATMIALWDDDSDIDSEYRDDNGPRSFHAQKSIIETNVARNRLPRAPNLWITGPLPLCDVRATGSAAARIPPETAWFAPNVAHRTTARRRSAAEGPAKSPDFRASHEHSAHGVITTKCRSTIPSTWD